MGHVVEDSDVDELVTRIKGAGITSVSDEAGDLNPPAVWVQVAGFTFDQLRGYTLNSRLVLVVPDQNPRRARQALIELLNKVLTVVKPTGPVQARTVALPESGALLPGLAVPLDVSTTPTPEEP